MNVTVRFGNGETLKDKINHKFEKTRYWIVANKEMILAYTPIVVGGLAVAKDIVKVVGKRVNLRKEETIKELYCYDRSLGHYWRLKRDLSNKEWLDVDRRKKNGERLADILSEMKVLK